MTLICIAGNTGAGKSTLLRSLEQALSTDGRDVRAIDESSFHHRLIQNLFDHPEAWGLPIQLNFLVERTAAIMELSGDHGRIAVMERSLSEDAIFFERLVERGWIAADLREPYEKLRAALVERCPPPLGYVFLRTDPQICIERLQNAMVDLSRPVELTGAALEEYVHELDAAYRRWRAALPPGTNVVDLEVVDIAGPSRAQTLECAQAIEAWIAG
jgi:deoxyadenosine/deoxycytidine kinase